jgi:disulfide bond formation protein DsbB
MEKLPIDRAKWPFIALLVSAAMLATAHVFERFGGYMPCALCLRQREVYWAAGGLALAAIAINWRGARPWLMMSLCLALGGVFLWSFGLSGYHSLVEWKVLPAPDTCTALPLNLNPDNILEQLNKPMHPPSCGDAAWRDPIVKLSMAGWNAIISIVLAGLSFFAAARASTGTDTQNETEILDPEPKQGQDVAA